MKATMIVLPKEMHEKHIYLALLFGTKGIKLKSLNNLFIGFVLYFLY